MDLDWGPEHDGPIVLVVHGLEGNSRSPYVQGVLRQIHQHEWQGLVMHFRGCSGEPNRLPRSYHSGDTADLAELLIELKKRKPDTSIYAVGFSLGGNALLKYLGESLERSLLSAAVAVCVPMVLSECAERLELGFSRVYQWWLLKSLKNKLRVKFARMPPPINLDDVWGCGTFRGFDDLVTAPLHGFRNADDYYRKVSSRQFLGIITTPTLIVHADDDPFMTTNVMAAPHELSAEVQIETTTGGGHIGFVSGAVPFWPRYWLDQRIAEFLSRHINLSQTGAEAPRI